MKKKAGFSAAGVSIYRPGSREPRADTRLIDASPRAPLNGTSSARVSRESTSDDDLQSLFQELAFHSAMEQMRYVVRTILLKVNKKRYNDARLFLQRHMQRVARVHERTEGDGHIAFPSLTKIPAVGIVSGSDATFSDVWMAPLCQVIHRAFPVILRVRDDFADARQMVEWVLQRLDEYSAITTTEQAWLAAQIDSFIQRDEPTQAEEETSNGRQLRSRSRRKRERSREYDVSGNASSDDNFSDLDLSESSSESDDDHARQANTNRSKRRKTSKPGRKDSVYAGLLLEELFVCLQSRLQQVTSNGDPSVGYGSALRDLVLEDLKMKLSQLSGGVDQSIAAYESCISWISTCVTKYRERTPSPSHLMIATAEFSLAILMQQVLTQFAEYLRSCEDMSASADAGSALSRAEYMLLRHEDWYHLHGFSHREYDHIKTSCAPFLIVCIESLDRFSLSALRDFVDLWGHHLTETPNGSTSRRHQLGFIFGVTSTTSQTLRLLGNSITRKLDIQFFPLEDSKTRSDDVMEELFVQNMFPLCLGGKALRLLNERHLISQSNTIFMQVLEFVALSHFQDQPWSFLSHFAFDMHHKTPIDAIKNASVSLRRRIRQSGIRGRTVADCLESFSDEALHSMLEVVVSKVKPAEALEKELLWFRRRRAAWAVGWKCFRAACEWFDVSGRGETFVESLAMALDGDLKSSKVAQWLTTMLSVQPIKVIVHLLSEWSGLTSSLDDQALQDDTLALLAIAHHIMENPADEETLKMRSKFRTELKHLFHSRILALVGVDSHPATSVRRLVHDWCTISPQLSSELSLHVTMNPHEDLMTTLKQLNGELYESSAFVSDMSLVFLYYEEHPAAKINLGDWFHEFAVAAREEVGRSQQPDKDQLEELHARFTRAIATMRRWGYITGPEATRGSSGRLEEMQVQKRIFI